MSLIKSLKRAGSRDSVDSTSTMSPVSDRGSTNFNQNVADIHNHDCVSECSSRESIMSSSTLSECKAERPSRLLAFEQFQGGRLTLMVEQLKKDKIECADEADDTADNDHDDGSSIGDCDDLASCHSDSDSTISQRGNDRSTTTSAQEQERQQDQDNDNLDESESESNHTQKSSQPKSRYSIHQPKSEVCYEFCSRAAVVSIVFVVVATILCLLMTGLCSCGCIKSGSGQASTSTAAQAEVGESLTADGGVEEVLPGAAQSLDLGSQDQDENDNTKTEQNQKQGKANGKSSSNTTTATSANSNGNGKVKDKNAEAVSVDHANFTKRKNTKSSPKQSTKKKTEKSKKGKKRNSNTGLKTAQNQKKSSKSNSSKKSKIKQQNKNEQVTKFSQQRIGNNMSLGGVEVDNDSKNKIKTVKQVPINVPKNKVGKKKSKPMLNLNQNEKELLKKEKNSNSVKNSNSNAHQENEKSDIQKNSEQGLDFENDVANKYHSESDEQQDKADAPVPQQQKNAKQPTKYKEYGNLTYREIKEKAEPILRMAQVFESLHMSGKLEGQPQTRIATKERLYKQVKEAYTQISHDIWQKGFNQKGFEQINVQFFNSMKMEQYTQFQEMVEIHDLQDREKNIFVPDGYKNKSKYDCGHNFVLGFFGKEIDLQSVKQFWKNNAPVDGSNPDHGVDFLFFELLKELNFFYGYMNQSKVFFSALKQHVEEELLKLEGELDEKNKQGCEKYLEYINQRLITIEKEQVHDLKTVPVLKAFSQLKSFLQEHGDDM